MPLPKPKVSTIAARVTKQTKLDFKRKAATDGGESKVLTDFIEAYLDGRAFIRPSKDKPHTSSLFTK